MTGVTCWSQSLYFLIEKNIRLRNWSSVWLLHHYFSSCYQSDIGLTHHPLNICRDLVPDGSISLSWHSQRVVVVVVNTLWTGDADLRLYITTVQDGWRKSAFLTRSWFPRTIHLITQYMEHFSEWSCWRMFIETRVFGEYFLKISVHKSS